MNDCCFSIKNEICADGISYTLERAFGGEIPVIICVGTDATVGDALGPMVGTALLERGAPAFVYGSLSAPVTAKEIEAVKEFTLNAHPYSQILVIDAAVGKSEDIGVVKILDGGIKPGLGANKNLPKLGNKSIIGIVAERTGDSQAIMQVTRIGFIYRFAEIITRGVLDYLKRADKGQAGKFSVI